MSNSLFLYASHLSYILLCACPYLGALEKNHLKGLWTLDATHGSLALKEYQQNLYLEYYY